MVLVAPVRISSSTNQIHVTHIQRNERRERRGKEAKKKPDGLRRRCSTPPVSQIGSSANSGTRGPERSAFTVRKLSAKYGSKAEALQRPKDERRGQPDVCLLKKHRCAKGAGLEDISHLPPLLASPIMRTEEFQTDSMETTHIMNTHTGKQNSFVFK